jgi:hypothetical protein
MDIKRLGLEELSVNEAIEVNGGWIWIPIIIAGVLMFTCISNAD